MIIFNNIIDETPYVVLKKKYDEALNAGQKNIEAIAISTYNKELGEVDSRFVNLKFIDANKFIFFSNYNSPKSSAFESHNQISALFYWSSINAQIRIKAQIKKTSIDFNNKYFKERSPEKNSLAISSNQSRMISSYDQVFDEYMEAKKNMDLLKCPNYWGGFAFIPYYFEFWEGHESRINKRIVFEIIDKSWKEYIIQP